MFLFWFRNITEQDGMRLETVKPFRRFYKDAGERKRVD